MEPIKVSYRDEDPPKELMFGKPTKWDELRKGLMTMPPGVWRKFVIPAGMHESARNSAITFIRNHFDNKMSFSTAIDRSPEESGHTYLYVKIERKPTPERG